MKKSIIAGAGVAAFAMAAVPFAGVFADGEITQVKDNLAVTVNGSCTYASVTPASASGAGNNYSVTSDPGQLVSLSASTATSFTVNCNDPQGYSITPTFVDLTLGSGLTSHDIIYGSGATEAAANSKTWTAYYSKNSGTATAFTASGTAITSASTMTDTYSLSYKVGLSNDQATGTYNGSATYNLTGNE